MLTRRSLAAVVVLAGLGLPAFGQEPVDLQWKFEKNKEFFQEMTTDTKQTMKVMGMEITQNQRQTFLFSWKPIDQDKDKNWTIEQTIIGVKMDIEIGGNKITYDSTNPGQAGNPLADFFKALVGSKFTLTLNPEMKVTKIEGREAFVKNLVAANQQMQPLLNQILSDEALKQMADPAFAAIPGKPVKPGESWTRKSTLNMGPIGSYETTYKYTFEGLDDKKLAKIKAENTLMYTPPGPNAAGGLPFTIKGADLKTTEATGTILFDPAKGRLESSEMSLKLNGTMKIEIGGMTTDVELSQSQKTTVKTTDASPIPKKS